MTAFGTDTVAATRPHLTLRPRGRSTRFDAFGLDPAAAARHYLTKGRREGRSITFDSLGYLATTRSGCASACNTGPVSGVIGVQ
ncbi:serralysin [Azospirillum oryzae]|uniref:Serralysin n=1 Tax=Azospirillum oryzae TaxID=286727 RepID=A0A1X7EYP0_9PROT|nr:hypothetical protein [Azospirillum oryzae]SMF42589.1 serralysin [Azospirillum oryzae]